MTAAVLLLACLSAAQSGSPTQLWEFSTALKDATDVLVADIVAGNSVDDGAVVRVRAKVRVVRVLRGYNGPGTELSLDWEYRPSPSMPLSVTSKISPVRGLWFLRKGASGQMEPLRAAYFAPALGAKYLHAAQTPWPYPSNAPLAVQIAHEIGAALEEMAVLDAADLQPRPMPPLNSGERPKWANTRTSFQSLAAALKALEPEATAAVYGRLSLHPEPNLKAVGLQGRFNQGDDTALIEFERNVAIVAPVFNVGGLPLSRSKSATGLPAAHAIGRIAVGEVAFEEMERLAPSLLASTRRPEVLPYLTIMLGSPEPNVRGSAMISLCSFCRGGALWQPGMEEHCPSSSLASDVEQERRNLTFWNAWWSARRDAIAKTATLPTVSRPSRYDASPFENAPYVPVDIDRRFMNHAFAAHVFASRPGPQPPDVLGALLDGNDLAVWRQALTAAAVKMEELQKRAADIRNAARVAGLPSDPNRYRALEQEERQWARQALNDLMRSLSSTGWQLVERYLKDPNSVRMPAGK